MHHQPQQGFRPLAGFRAARPTLALGSALLIALFAGGCATTPPPTAEIAVSAAAVAHAAASGAPELAPQDMRRARDKLDLANAAMTGKNYDQARNLAEQAEADARLAEAKTEALRARKATDDAMKSNDILRQEMNRKTQNPQ